MRRLALLGLLLPLVIAVSLARAADVLLDQTTPAGGGSSTASVHASGYSGETADDFTVPAGVQWSITELDTKGLNYGGRSDESITVHLYADTGGLPGDEQATQTVVTSTTSSDLAIALSPALVAGPGHHWISFQTNGTGTDSEYFWSFRSTQSGSPAAYRQPTGSCTTWTKRSDCQSGAAAPDQLFELKGTSSPVAEPSPTVTATPTPTGGTPTVSPTATPTATPVLSPTPTPTPTTGDDVTLPSAKICVRRRRLTVRIGKRVKKAAIKVGHKRRKTYTHKRKIKLTHLPRGTFKLRITLKLKNGATVKRSRTYHACKTHH